MHHFLSRCALCVGIACFAVASADATKASLSQQTRTAATLPPTPSETILWKFSGLDGIAPEGGMFADAAGALYGTTELGGTYDQGTVYKLTPSGSKYIETVLWSFGKGFDGRGQSTNLIADGSGAIFGTTSNGGTHGSSSGGYGTVFKLTPSGGGKYTERVIWNFRGGSDAKFPTFGVIEDSSGALYGTAQGGAANSGCVFKLTPSGGGNYTERLLWTFTGPPDGASPAGGLIADAQGALYGTTLQGGAISYYGGTVFKLTPQGSSYTETILWNLGNGKDGAQPSGGLVAGKYGGLTGMTIYGGEHHQGTVFKLVPSGNHYAERVLWSFGNERGGRNPQAGVIVGRSGSIYGTTTEGGAYGQPYGLGVLFRLTPQGNNYVESVLWNFGNGSDGWWTQGNLIANARGSLIGATSFGGVRSGGECYLGCGVIYRVTP